MFPTLFADERDELVRLGDSSADRLAWVCDNLNYLDPPSFHPQFAHIYRVVERRGWSPILEQAMHRLFGQAWWMFEADVGKAMPDLSSLYEIFATSRSRLKRPAVTMLLPGMETPIRISIATEFGRRPVDFFTPGDLRIEDADRGVRDFTEADYGRIDNRNGAIYTRHTAPVGLIKGLLKLAEDPIKCIIEYGRSTGYCCFCNSRLTGEYATTIGFGQTCARNWGLEQQWRDALNLLATAEAEKPSFLKADGDNAIEWT